MSSDPRALPLGLSNDIGDYARAARVVLSILARIVFLAIAVWLLGAVRSGQPPHVQFFFYLLAMGSVFIALGGTNFRVWALYITAFVLFAQLRGFADEIGTPTHFNYPIEMEKALFFGVLPTIWLQDRLYTFAQLGILETYTMAVYLSYFFLPHVMAFALWKWDNPRFKTYAFAFMATLYCGLLTSAVLPTAPPWMAGQLGYIPHVYQVVSDIAGEVTPGTYENVYEIAGANPVAAMPSLHAAIPFLMALALWKYPWVRCAGAAYAGSMLFAIVYLGEHYAVDGFIGWAVAGGCWVAVSAYLRRQDEKKAAIPKTVTHPAEVPVAASADATKGNTGY